jgi:DNA-binding response OmpR family regulator
MNIDTPDSILIVEDESLIALDIKRTLLKKGYRVCGCADNAEEAVEMVKTHRPALVLMDISLHGSPDGIEAAKIIKENFDTSVIFLTAYSDDKTISNATSLSPDGYIVKPFNQGTLLAAVKLALEKKKPLHENTIYVTRCERCSYDLKRKILHCGQEEIYLTNKERKLLELLIRYRGNIVPFDLIDMELWPDKAVSETTRRTLLHRLRKKVGEHVLETVIGTGCRLHMKEKR